METIEFEFYDNGTPQIGSIGAMDAEELYRRMQRGEALSFVERLAAEAYARTRGTRQGTQRQAVAVGPLRSQLSQVTARPAGSTGSASRGDSGALGGGYFGSQSSSGAGDLDITLQPNGSYFDVEDLLFSSDDTAATLQQIKFNNSLLFFGASSAKGPLLSDLKGDSLVRNWLRGKVRIDNTNPLIITVKFSAASKFCSVTALGTPSNLACAAN